MQIKRLILVLLLTAGCFTPDFVVGDVNMDHRITAADARLVLQSIAECRGLCSTLQGRQRHLADVNGDKEITAADASLILALAGPPEMPPPPCWDEDGERLPDAVCGERHASNR